MASRHSISDATRRQIEGFTRHAVQTVAQAQMRRTMTALGYPDRRIALTNPDVLKQIDAYAAKRADAIQSTVNRMIDNRMKTLPEGGNVEAHLKPVLDGIHAYNQDRMLPAIQQEAQHLGESTFHAMNGIPSTWSWVLGDNPCEQCSGLEGDYSPDDAQSIQSPHPSTCQCSWDVQTDTGNLPSVDDLWVGG